VNDFIKNNWPSLAFYAGAAIAAVLVYAAWHYGWCNHAMSGSTCGIIEGVISTGVSKHLADDAHRSKLAELALGIVNAAHNQTIK
jgi:hypothetical protein